MEVENRFNALDYGGLLQEPKGKSKKGEMARVHQEHWKSVTQEFIGEVYQEDEDYEAVKVTADSGAVTKV